MGTEIREQNVLIANRVVGESDTWILVGEGTKRTSLTEALEAYFQKTGTPTNFRLEPLNDKLFAIIENEEEIIQEKPKTFNIYRD